MKVRRSATGTGVLFQVSWIFQLNLGFSARDVCVRCEVTLEYVNIIKGYVDAFSPNTSLNTS
jgi:hypothetical protein